MASDPVELLRPLKGAERVAALLLAMDKDLAQRVLKHFDQGELREVTRSVAGLGSVSFSAVEPLVQEFQDHFTRGGVNILGTVGEAQELIKGVVSPEQVADIMAEFMGGSNKFIWERLSMVPGKLLREYLVKEHPQTAAAVLSKVSPSGAAKVLARVPAELRAVLVRRMMAATSVGEMALRILETTLRDDLRLDEARDPSAIKSVQVAEVIKRLDREQIDDVLENLGRTRPKAAEALRNLVFTFDDITKLSDRARTIVLDEVAPEQILLALQGATIQVRDAVMGALGTRLRRMVEFELQSDTPRPQKDVREARRAIATLVLKLAAQGKISLGTESEEEEED